MKSKIITNSKYRNPGVLFDLLVRQVTADTLAGRTVSEALNIMKKYFNASTELGKEMQLYRAFFEGKGLTETKALHFIELVVTQRRKLDERKLVREKYDLIKDIKQHYPLKEFLAAKIDNYVINASIYKTFLAETAKDQSYGLVNIRDIATAKFTLVEYLTGRGQKKPVREDAEVLQEFKQESEELRLLAYKIAVDRFNEKYAGLNDNQKVLLREYINNVSNTNSLSDFMKREVPTVRARLLHVAGKTDDRILAIKLNEVSNQLEAITKKPTVRENEITALMIAYEILKEIQV